MPDGTRSLLCRGDGGVALIWTMQSAFLLALDRGLRAPSARLDGFFETWSPGASIVPLCLSVIVVTSGGFVLKSISDTSSVIPIVGVALGILLAALLASACIRSFVGRRSYVAG